MDDPDEKKGIYKNKKVNLQKFDNLFKEHLIVPLYGDMHVQLLSHVRSGPHYDENRWTGTLQALDSGVFADKYNICTILPRFQEERDTLVSKLALMSSKDIQGNLAVAIDINACDVAIDGLRVVSNWTTTIHELYSWKLANPTDKYSNKECPADAEDYERAIRYNFSVDEKDAIVQVIAMIKDVLRQMWKMQAIFSMSIRATIHHEMQTFVQHDLRDMIRHCVKKKKAKARTILVGLRNTCADWTAGVEPEEDPFMKGIKDPVYIPPEIKTRHCGPGSTQLYMMRTMVESLIPKKLGKADLDNKFFPLLQAFLDKSKIYNHLLSFNASLQKAADLSQLWYREFYLELSNGQHVQFPSDMSFPWILVNHVLSHPSSGLYEFTLFPLDLYNDSANYALYHFKQQYLYDEVQAEVDLCFDQFIFKLSDTIFTTFRCHAAEQVLLARTSSKGKKSQSLRVSQGLIETILRQRHFQLLGRTVNIQKLLSQRLNVTIKDAINAAISRFESGNLMGIMELSASLEVSKLMHESLGEYLTLDSFEELLNEANNSVTSPYGRMTLHVFAELCTDLIPNFCFNNATKRFVRPRFAPIFGEGEPKRDNPPRINPELRFGSKTLNHKFSTLFESTSQFFSIEHLKMALKLIEYRGIALCMEELLKIVKSNISSTLTPYVSNLLEGMPKACKLPLLDYGTKGTVGFYQIQLKDVMAYPDLQTEFCHSFREVGNSFVILNLMEEALNQLEVEESILASPFQGNIPVAAATQSEYEEKRASLVRANQHMFFLDSISVRGTAEDQEMAAQADQLTKERLFRGLSLFKNVLKKLGAFLLESEVNGQGVWCDTDPSNGIMDTDKCNQFYRLWSAVQFILVLIAAERGVDQISEFFGDGVQWAAAVLISLIGHKDRFMATDFCGHVLKAFEHDHTSEVVGTVDLRKFVEFSRRRARLNESIFQVMERYLGEEGVQTVEDRLCSPTVLLSGVEADDSVTV